MTLPQDASVRNTQALAALLGVGIFFLIFTEYKVFGAQFTLHGGFQFWINKFLEGGACPFIVPVLRGFVLPLATLFAFLTAYGELVIGLALLLGVWVRPASAAGFLFSSRCFFLRMIRDRTPPFGNTSARALAIPCLLCASLRF
jgi:uncharacterized membrane protein YphA (DoxX/SURF4 family)